LSQTGHSREAAWQDQAVEMTRRGNCGAVSRVLCKRFSVLLMVSGYTGCT
jgi:hypothetical protein